MTVVLEIDTTKSLFEPIEVKIDGELFRVKELTLDMLENLQKAKNDIGQGSAEAIKEMLGDFIDGRVEAFGKLTLSNLEKIIGIIVEKSISPKGPEKNVQKPGATI
jgi:hypothetical protein